MCSHDFCLFLKKQIVAVGKSKVTTTKEQRTTQFLTGCTTTSTERRAHSTALFAAARKPTACIYFSAFRWMRLSNSVVVSKAYVKKCREAKRSSDACSVKKTQKRANRKQSIRRTKKRRALLIVRGEASARCIACLGSLRS